MIKKTPAVEATAISVHKSMNETVFYLFFSQYWVWKMNSKNVIFLRKNLFRYTIFINPPFFTS